MAMPSTGEPALPTANLNPYFLDLDRLLAHIEKATSYYQTLKVGRDASRDQIDTAFRDTVRMLYPPYQVGATLPPALLARIDRAFTKLTQAFAVLASFTRRKEYDSGRSSAVAASPVASPIASPVPAPRRPSPSPAVSLRAQATTRNAHVESARETSSHNRRRTDRLKLFIPARVVGVDQQSEGKWSEMAETLDVSRTGVRLRLNRPVRYGMVLYLSLPLPPKLRSHGFTDPSYNVYALVRRIEPPKKGVRIIGLEFIGERPPPGYLDKPWGTFRTTRWAGNERRRSPRAERSEAVRLDYISADRPTTFREEARCENISRTGMRVVVRAAPPEFDLVRVTCAARQFEGLAIVRNRFQGKDGLERLCLQLLDKTWPV
jgi:hypothetical protein